MFNAYVFAAVAMIFWGLAPIFGKLGLTRMDPLSALTVRSVISTLILIVAMYLSGNWGNISISSPQEVGFIALEGICGALVGQLAYYYALKLGEVSTVSPMVSAFPLVAIILAVIFLGEKVTFIKVIAALLIVTGITLLRL